MCAVANILDTYPLTPLQQGMLFHNLYNPGSGVDHQQIVCTLREPIDAARLAQAWQQVIAHHPVLRTSFDWSGAEPGQLVHAQVSCELEQLDWRQRRPDRQAEQLREFLQRDAARGFDLARVPLMRLTLIRQGDEQFQLVWSNPHILLDGLSLQIVLRQVFEIYDAACPLAPARPYRDFVAWLAQYNPPHAEDFWRRLLTGFATPTSLGLSAPPNPDATHHTLEKNLTPELTRALNDLAQKYNVTLNTLVQTAWAILCQRYSGEQEVVFGATRACRRSALDGVGTEAMVGLFINTLPVRAYVSPTQSLVSLFQELRAQSLALREYEHTPLSQVQAWSALPRGTALFGSIVVFDRRDLNDELRALGGNWLRREFKIYSHTNFALTLAANGGAQMRLALGYDRAQFDDATIERMLGHLAMILSSFVARPDQSIAQVDLLTARETHQLLVEWNDTATPAPQSQPVHQLFESQVAQTPDAIALVRVNQQLTYAELNRRANQLAHYLRGLGVSTETLVGICVERSLDTIVAMLGVLKAGGAYVPLDPTFPRSRLEFMIDDTRMPVILTQDRLTHLLPARAAQIVRLDADWARIAQSPLENVNALVRPEQLIYIIYTSGSTGKPKGVMVEHGALSNFVASSIHTYEITARDRVLQFASSSFDGNVIEIYTSLTRGATLVLRTEEMLASVPNFFRQCAEWNITVNYFTTPYWHEIVREGLDTFALPPTLRMIIMGGDNALDDDLAAWHRHVGTRVRLMNSYGPTEITVGATHAELTQVEGKAVRVSIGRPIENYQAFILDALMRPVPIGVIGELHIGGVGVARGYLNRPDLTAERFVPNPFETREGARLYKTGDLARYRMDGNIEFLGRADRQIKIRGYRVELGEIESALLQHPAIRDVAITIHSAPSSPTDKWIVAYYVNKPNVVCALDDLRDFLRIKLPDYMMPAAFVRVDAIPKTPSKKVDWRALPEPAAESTSKATWVAPRTPTEQTVADIWQQVLGVPRIGVTDNFFELGGHSLLATRVVSRLHQAFNVDLPVRRLFESPTVGELAAEIERNAFANREEMTL